jgi:hypothetical protein
VSTTYSQRIVIPWDEFVGVLADMPRPEGECWPYPVDPKANVQVQPQDGSLASGPRPLRRVALWAITGMWPDRRSADSRGKSVNTCGTRKCINPEHADYGG